MTDKRKTQNKESQATFRAKKKAEESEAIRLLKEILKLLKENDTGKL